MPRPPAGRCIAVLPNGDQCPEKGTKAKMCRPHYRVWAAAAIRCDFPECNRIVTIPGNGPTARRINGRRMQWPDGPRTYCRLHEPLHLRMTPETEALNLARLGAGLTAGGPDGMSWLWLPGPGRHTDDGYGKFVPEGGGTSAEWWPVHRVALDLFSPTGLGHGQGQVIDHRSRIRDDANPAFLEAVSQAENAKRRGRPPRGPSRAWWSEKAERFAAEHGLPNPFRTTTATVVDLAPSPPNPWLDFTAPAALAA